MSRTFRIFSVAAFCSLLLMVAFSAVVLAEETETPTTITAQDTPLHPPIGMDVADGTGIAMGSATPCDCGAATLTVDLPEGAAVQQVLLYWYAGLLNNQSPPSTVSIGQGIVVPPDPLQTVPGVWIGGPTPFFMRSGEPVYFSAFRADITEPTAAWFAPGMSTTITVDLPFTVEETVEEAAGLLVIYDDGSLAEVALIEGMDLAFFGFDPPLRHTVPQSLTFTAAGKDREALVYLMIGSEGETAGRDRPNEMTVTAGDTDYSEICTGNCFTLLWDSHEIGPIVVPASVADVQVQVQSLEIDTDNELGASLAWIMAALVVEEPPAIELSRLPDVWIYTITNPSTEIALEKIMVYAGPYVTVGCPQQTLAPGLSMRCTATSQFAPEHAAYHANIAWVYAQPEGGGTPVIDWVEPDP